MMKEVRIGILGYGTVGRGVVSMLINQAELLEQRSGLPLRLVRIATRSPGRDRGIDLGAIELTDDLRRVVGAADIDVVVELIGGLEPARTLVLDALEHGQHVVTANKALIAEHGAELLAKAAAAGVELLFEAGVAGAVPIIKALKESLAGNRVDWIYGILNGTCNYILTEMREKGLPFDEVLAQAQAQGYAEADPAFDVDGVDAAHKLTILAAIAFGTPPDFSRVHVEGIRHVSDVDIAWATEMGYRIKLLGMARLSGDLLELRVQPTLVPDSGMVASVEGVFNAVFVRGDYSGTTMYHGRGAGENPTASAVLADLVDIARNERVGARGRVAPLAIAHDQLKPLAVRNMADWRGEYYLRMGVADRPGVLAEISAILARHRISIDTLHQKGRSNVEAVPLVVLTHETGEREIQSALVEIERLSSVLEKPRLIRIEKGLA